MASVIFLAAILFGLFLLGLIYKTCIEGRIKFASLKTIPTIGKRHFLWGHLHLNKKPGSPEFIKQHFDLMKQYKHLYQLWIGNLFPYVVICSGEAAGVILKHTRNIEKSRPYTKIQPWLGLSVLTSTGSIWKQKRRMLTPAFHYNILQDYIPIYHQCGSIMMEKLQQAADSKTPVEIFRLITTCTLDIIGLCAFGYDINAQKGNTDYVTSIYKLSTLFATSIYSPQLVLIRLIFGERVFETFTEVGREWKKSYQIVHELPDRVIKSRREALQRGDQGGVCSVTRTGKTYTDFLHILLTTTNSETGQPLGDQEIRDEVDTFMFEGHDTTSSGLVWAMYELATHPEAQKKVAQELDEIMGDKEYPDYDDLEKMNYLYCVIKETLRLHPPVPEIGRVLSEPVDILGHHLPAGTQLTINPYLIHRNPLDWKKPDDFIPERFDVNSPEYDPDRNAYSFVPFSAGPRNCIGQNFALNEEKTLLAMVFKKFFVEISPDQPLPVEPIIEIITRPSGGVRLTVKERSAL